MNEDDYACSQYKVCDTNCVRKTIFNSQKWFSAWIDGEPDKNTDCKFYKKPKVSLIESLL